MAGGLILLGVLAWLTPVAVAMVLHGAIQMVSNGSRAAFLWRHISWRVIGRYVIGVAVAVALLAFIAWRPSEPVVFVLLGLTLHYAPWLLNWFGRLPGDIRHETEHGRVFIPITSMIVVSVVLSLLLHFFNR